MTSISATSLTQLMLVEITVFTSQHMLRHDFDTIMSNLTQGAVQ